MSHSHFTHEQLQEISAAFGIPLKLDLVRVRDGHVSWDAQVWWKCEDGPQRVVAETHRENILRFPHLYSRARPEYSVTYKD